MAYLPESEKDKEAQAQQQGATSEGVQQGVMLGGGQGGTIQGQAAPTQSQVSQPATGMQAAAQSKPGRAGGARFTNLSSYLNANKEQAGQLAGNIAGSVGQEADTALSQLGQAKQTFQKKAQESGPQFDAGLVSSVKQGGNIGEREESSLRNILQGQYTGPRGLTDVEGGAQAIEGTQKAQSKIGLTENEGGRAALLQEQAQKAGGRYGGGLQRFDEMLLGGTQEGKSRLEQLRGKYSNLSDVLSGTQKDVGTLAQQREADIAAQRKQAEEAVAANEASLKSGLLGQTASKNAELAARQAELDAAVRGQKKYMDDMSLDYNAQKMGMTRDQYIQATGQNQDADAQAYQKVMKDLGIDNQKYQQLQKQMAQEGSEGGDVLGYLMKTGAISKGRQATTADVASAEQKARYQALQRLMGSDLGGYLGEKSGPDLGTGLDINTQRIGSMAEGGAAIERQQAARQAMQAAARAADKVGREAAIAEARAKQAKSREEQAQWEERGRQLREEERKQNRAGGLADRAAYTLGSGADRGVDYFADQAIALDPRSRLNQWTGGKASSDTEVTDLKKITKQENEKFKSGPKGKTAKSEAKEAKERAKSMSTAKVAEQAQSLFGRRK